MIWYMGFRTSQILYSGLSKHHALLGTGVSISNATPGTDGGGVARSRQHRDLGKRCALQRPLWPPGRLTPLNQEIHL